MSERINCPRCHGSVVFPAAPTENVTCPFCRQFLVAVDRKTGAAWRPRQGAPTWMRPTGALLVVLGLLGFLGGVIDENHRKGATDASRMVAGTANPYFFAGLPVGIWLATRRRRVSMGPSDRRESVAGSSDQTQEGQP